MSICVGNCEKSVFLVRDLPKWIALSFTADVSRTTGELAALRQATPRVAPPNAAAPQPPPVGPALVAANDRYVYERDERGRLFERTSDPTTSSRRSYLAKGLVALSAGG